MIQRLIWSFLLAYKKYRGRPSALKRAAKKANKKARKTGLQYNVYFIKGKYQVLNKYEVKRLKRQNVFNKNVNMGKLAHIRFYSNLAGYSDFAIEFLNAHKKQQRQWLS
ncbi:MAG: hypothetical protein ACK5L5_03495 [Bacteroidales bacterium]